MTTNAYVKIQVIKKQISIDMVLAETEMAAAFIEDKLQRQAAFMLARGLSSQIKMLTGEGLAQFLLPAWANVRRLLPDEVRVRLQSGEFVVANASTGEMFVQLPIEATTFKFRMLNNMTDRGPINTALLHFLMSQDYMVASHWGPFHGIWNAIKNSLKRSNQGRPWQSVLGLLLVSNMNYFPFQSSQGFRDKQEGLKSFLASHDHECEDFQQMKSAFARANSQPCTDSEADDQALFDLLGKMRSFSEKGPLLKLQRWCSINTCWHWIRPELAGLRLILGHMLQRRDPTFLAGEAGTQQSMDEEVLASWQKPGGTLEKAHSWIRPYNVVMLDMIDMVTMPLRNRYGYLAAEVKTPEQGLADNMQQCRDGLWTEVHNIAKSAFHDEIKLQSLLFEGGGACPAWAQELMDFTFELLGYRAEVVMPEVQGMPGSTVLCLSDDIDERARHRELLLHVWQVIMKIERATISNGRLASMWQSVVWKDRPLVRLLCMMNEIENGQAAGPGTTYLLEGIHMKVPDEKAAEDIHQYLRDETRRQRFKAVAPLRVMRSAIFADIAKQRGIPRVSVDISELCDTTRYDETQAAVRHKFLQDNQPAPPRLTKLTADRTWPSPTTHSYLQSESAWSWLFEWFGSDVWRRNKVPAAAAWRAKLVPGKVLLGRHNRMWLVVRSCQCSLLVWDVDCAGHGLWKLSLSGPAAFNWHFLVQCDGYSLYTIQAEYHPGKGVLMRAVEKEGLLRSALLRRVRLQKAELQDLHDELASGVWDSGDSIAVATQKLQAICFNDDMTEFEARLKNQEGNCKSDDEQTDEMFRNMGELLEEIQVHDPDNWGEVQEISSQVKKHKALKLMKQRETVRTLKAQVKRDALRKKKEKEKQKKRKKIEAIKKKAFPLLHLLTRKKRGKGKGKGIGKAPAADLPPLPAAPAGDIPPLPAAPAADLPPLPPPLAPPGNQPGAGDTLVPAHVGGQQGARASGPRAGPSVPPLRIYSTPALLKTLCPPGGSIGIDIPACRWRAKFRGTVLPTISFGPHSGCNRRQALEFCLSHLWNEHPGARPEASFVSAVPIEAWQGLLDERVEAPRKYPKTKQG